MWFNIFLKPFWTAFNELCQTHSPWGRSTKLNLVFILFYFFLQMLEAVKMGSNLLRHYLSMSG